MSLLVIPTTGFGRSVSSHNVEIDVLCDWIEASILFGAENISKREIVDELLENNVYQEQQFATELVDMGWSELRKRHSSLLTHSPLIFKNQSVELSGGDWRLYPGHSFCLILSLMKWYKDWAKKFGANFTKQGELFELMVRDSVQSLFNEWVVSVTGWSRCQARKLNEVVDAVVSYVGEPRTTNLERWTTTKKNEAGLDLVCRRRFRDGRGGCPVYLFQCASGGNYEDKLHTPNLLLWRRLIEFTAMGMPQKAFATPFAFLDDQFTRNCNLVDGLLLDRYRILEAVTKNELWLTPSVSSEIIEWTQSRVNTLPFAPP